MSPERFEHLLTAVGPLFTKKSCPSRQPTVAAERLMSKWGSWQQETPSSHNHFCFELVGQPCHTLEKLVQLFGRHSKGNTLLLQVTHMTGWKLQMNLNKNGIFQLVLVPLMENMSCWNARRMRVLLLIVTRDSIASSWCYAVLHSTGYWRGRIYKRCQYIVRVRQEGFLRNPSPHSVVRAILHMVVKLFPMLLSDIIFFAWAHGSLTVSLAET